ncbi:MAG: hypothetical protein AAF823_08160 [Planctomycetota bacterium]
MTQARREGDGAGLGVGQGVRRRWRVPGWLVSAGMAAIVVGVAWRVGPTWVPAAEREVRTLLTADGTDGGGPAGEDGEAAPRKASRSELLGIDAARDRLGEALPDGSGVRFAHVEGLAGKYLPNRSARGFAGVRFHPQSGEGAVSGHAHRTAATVYGRGGLAPGVEDVDVYTSQGYLAGVLRTGTLSWPMAGSADVHTHSWVAPEHRLAEEMLLRLDALVDRDDRLVVMGVMNGRETAVPALLASSFNGIAVGTASGSGASSGGYTGGAWPGRCKPDVVGATGLTSFATPQVAAVVARLLEAARGSGMGEGTQAEVVKALLLAGASKPWGWSPQDGRPLDEHLGAGVAHLDNALRILEGGATLPALGEGGARAGEASGQAGRFGWWFGSLEPGGHARWRVAVEAGEGPVSVVAVWHRRVATAMEGAWLPREGLADFDLLASVEPAEGAGGPSAVLGLSRSKVDNVEHVFAPAGRVVDGVLCIDLVRPRSGGRGFGADGSWEVAVAWRVGGWDPRDGPAWGE